MTRIVSKPSAAPTAPELRFREWETQEPALKLRNDARVAAFERTPGFKLVDLGCGADCGFVGAYLEQNPHHLALGLDSLGGPPPDPRVSLRDVHPLVVPERLVVRDATRSGLRPRSVDRVTHLMPLPATLATLFPAIAREAARILVPGGQFQVVLQGPSWERDRTGEAWEARQRTPLLASLVEAGFHTERDGVLLRPGSAAFVDTAFARQYSEDGAPGIYSFVARLPVMPSTANPSLGLRAAITPPAWVIRARASGEL